MAEKKIKNDPETGYRLAGIASSLREFQFCFHLNRLLECDFRKLKDISFESADKNRQVHFSVFRADQLVDEVQYTVFLNKMTGEILLPEVSNFDYILRVDGKFADDKMENVVNGMRQFPHVVMSAEIPIKKIKSRERLIYEEEREPRKLFQQKKKLVHESKNQ